MSAQKKSFCTARQRTEDSMEDGGQRTEDRMEDRTQLKQTSKPLF